jgi:hypothetical protein
MSGWEPTDENKSFCTANFSQPQIRIVCATCNLQVSDNIVQALFHSLFTFVCNEWDKWRSTPNTITEHLRVTHRKMKPKLPVTENRILTKIVHSNLQFLETHCSVDVTSNSIER